MHKLFKSHQVRGVFVIAVATIVTLTPLATSLSATNQSSGAAPSDADIFRSRAFLEPLVPIGGKTTPEENSALQKAIELGAHAKDPDDDSAFVSFLKRFPHSPWRAALLTNLGLKYRYSGWFLKALSGWEEAWRLSKNDNSIMGKPMADRAIGELLELNARLGRKERVQSLLKEVEGRSLEGPATEKVTAAREGLWIMHNEPGNAFKCGPFALSRIMAADDPMRRSDPKIIDAQSTDHGISLDRVYQLSQELGMNYQMAKRRPGSKVIVPCVVNWKADHYAALTREDHGRFVSSDPTFGKDILVSKAALDAESSGYFLVPKGKLPVGWERVSASEASRIWGMGTTADHDPTGTKCIDDKAKPDCGSNCGAMARYNFHTQVVSLNITDTPIGYTPPRGPDMHFTVTYNQREVGGFGAHSKSNFGSKWVCNWISWVDGDPTSGPAASAVYLPNGGYEYFVPSNGAFLPAFQSGATLAVYPDPPPGQTQRFERTLPDGSRQVFDLRDYIPFYHSNSVYMTKLIDPSGNTVHFNYDGNFRLTSVTDASGQVTTISHLSDNPGTLPDFYLIHQITDPFGRSATFDYQNGQLVAIHDTIGITSQFAYATPSDTCGCSACPSDFIKSMITPYGITTFSQPDSVLDAASGCGNARVIQAVDPTLAVERLEYGHQAPGISATDANLPTVPGVTINNSNYNNRNNYYWDKKVTALYPPIHDSTCNCDVYDYTKAKITQWLHASYAPAIYDNDVSNSKEREKQPLENPVYYLYQGQGGANATLFTGNQGWPSAIARVLDDGSTQLWQYTYNSIGKVTKVIDPSGRVTSYQYDTNSIDLLNVYQRNPAGISHDPDGANADLIASYSYNSAHEPLTSAGADGQITNYVYLSSGQIQVHHKRSWRDNDLRLRRKWQSGRLPHVDHKSYV